MQSCNLGDASPASSENGGTERVGAVAALMERLGGADQSGQMLCGLLEQHGQGMILLITSRCVVRMIARSSGHMGCRL